MSGEGKPGSYRWVTAAEGTNDPSGDGPKAHGVSRNGGTEEGASESPRTPADTIPVPEPDQDGQYDLTAPEYFLNRELTWLNFNFRVLHEAEDPRTPLLERVKFLSIVSSNLDEFFMKRIGGLKQVVGAGIQEPSLDGRTPKQQIKACYELVRQLEARKTAVCSEVFTELRRNGIEIVSYETLSKEEKTQVRDFYFDNIFPLVTPQAIDPAHPFPFVSNLALNLLVSIRYPGEDLPTFARIKVPTGSGTPRLHQVVEGEDRFVLLEDVMAHNLDLLFPGGEVLSSELFRVTRNSNTEKDEERAEDLLALIESELRERRFAPIVRVETQTGMGPNHQGVLAAELGLDARDVFEVEGMLGMRDLMELMAVEHSDLKDPAHHPIDHPELTKGRSIFHAIRDTQGVLLHHPYEAFSSSVVRFLREASEDPKVRAIKITLYRTSAESRVIDYLINAARNGKQVAVVVEIKARFDEEANINWANRMEEAGIHVTYGVVGLKTHCKVTLVVRQDFDGLRRYAHIGTGNYHAGTARIYTDYGLLTSDDKIGQDLTELFNYLTTGYKPKRHYHRILPAPKVLKKALLDKIEREIELHTKKNPGLIRMKLNALEDEDITRALYRASQFGVKVDLIIRDTCRLRPGIKGLSNNITVVSLVGRFLEHARVCHFRNGGEDEYYIGSADCMKRNLESRVEVLVPIECPRLQKEMGHILDLQIHDQRSAWEMRADGSYVQREPEADVQSSQTELIQIAERRSWEARRLRTRKPQGITKRKVR